MNKEIDEMLRRFLLLPVVMVAALSACAERWDIEAVRNIPAPEDVFAATLKEEYQNLASKETRSGDWGSVAYFLARARSAVAGTLTEPQPIAERVIPASALPALYEGRESLMVVLDAGAREEAPELAARAIAQFDCWLEIEEQFYQTGKSEDCRESFVGTIKDIKESLWPPTEISRVIHFQTGSFELDPDAMSLLEEVVSAYEVIRSGAAGNGLIEIAGYVTPAGSPQETLLLSQKYTQVVAEALMALGVPLRALSVKTQGQQEPATGEGESNRVEITIKEGEAEE